MSFRFRNAIKALVVFLFISFSSSYVSAQCPPNIDFEQGNLNGWQCYTGNLVSPSQYTIFPSLPIANRHEILSANPGGQRDPYGFFPVNCPNGSGYSMKLGNDQGGGELDGVSYTFTIPAGQNQFNLIYNYAAVLQDGQANHDSTNQPRLLIRVRNVTDDSTITCSSFPFIVGSINGFQTSTVNSTVLFKPWAANSIILDGLAGKTIELFFITTDCGFTAHFGYAYIDVNTECSSAFVGAAYCRDDTSINVTAPFGYETYTWYDDVALTNQIGTGQVINFTPPPPSGTIVYVKMTPFSGYGCVSVLSAVLLDTLTLQAQAGPDLLSCQNAPVQLGINPRPNYVYSWSPPTGLSDPNIANPIASPSVTTEYVLTVSTPGGGCATTDTVIVSAAVLDDSLRIDGPVDYCLSDTTAWLHVSSADSIQWYMNNVAIPGANDTFYHVLQTGSYHASLFSFVGCDINTATVNFVVNPSPDAGFMINTLDQCFNNNQFVFTDTSKIAFGTMQYNWDLGDGNTEITQHVTHTYTQPGTYIVKLTITSDMGCIDSVFYTVNVFDSPVAGFDSNIKELCFKNNQFVFTNSSTLANGTMQYNWNMGDGNIFTSRDVTHSYTAPGTYTVRLTLTTDRNCIEDSAFDVTVYPAPVAGFGVANPQQCFTGNSFNFLNNTTLSAGTLQYAWNLGDGNTANTRDVTHTYSAPGDYTVKMVATSNQGCADSMSFNVKVFPYPTADFYVAPACINLRLPITNKTINNAGMPLYYLWDFGNGITSTQINPVYSYPAPGNYTVKLSVSTSACPLTINTKQQDVVIDAPAIPMRYTDETAVMNFPEQLNARQIGTSVIWTPSIHLDNSTSFNPTFKGLTEQLYTIHIKSPTGCVTVDTQLVKIKKKIEIYVPTAFTPNGDAINQHLRPTLMGFVKVNYFRVYNRWGKLLYQMQSDLPGWDGRLNGARQETQTVVWMIEAVDVDGVTHKRQGTTVLLN